MRWIAILLALGCSACLRSAGAFSCDSHDDCARGGTVGICELVGYCSFDDPACAGGRRFGDLSGPYSNQCVDGTVVDAASIDSPPGSLCVGVAPYIVCVPPPSAAVTLTGSINTGTSTLCATAQPAEWMSAGQPAACFIVGTTITVGGTVTFTGSRPLVLVASESITVSGTLDASSHRGGAAAPGAPSTSCKAFVQAPGNEVNGAAGGAGASFMSKGGDGGDGAAALVHGIAPTADATAPTKLRAGCSGQRGGTGDGGAAANPGIGGGAVYLASAGTITISGTINASGAGTLANADTSTRAGGSGGGSGGMIKLHATTIVSTGGRLLVNGGGGASGANQSSGGNPGSDPAIATPTTPAVGGASLGNSGAGGDGFAGGAPATNATAGTGSTGGGAGGGGGGYVQSNLPLSAATVSAGRVDDP